MKLAGWKYQGNQLFITMTGGEEYIIYPCTRDMWRRFVLGDLPDWQRLAVRLNTDGTHRWRGWTWDPATHQLTYDAGITTVVWAGVSRRSWVQLIRSDNPYLFYRAYIMNVHPLVGRITHLARAHRRRLKQQLMEVLT